MNQESENIGCFPRISFQVQKKSNRSENSYQTRCQLQSSYQLCRIEADGDLIVETIWRESSEKLLSCGLRINQLLICDQSLMEFLTKLSNFLLQMASKPVEPTHHHRSANSSTTGEFRSSIPASNFNLSSPHLPAATASQQSSSACQRAALPVSATIRR
jgi:hypothetical protein